MAAAAAVGAVATGTLTALLPGTPAPTEAPVVDGVGSPVLAASAGVLRDIGRTTAVTPAETMVPVAYGFDEGDRDAATEQRVASVEKAGRLAAQLADLHAQELRGQAGRARTSVLIRSGGLDGWIAEALRIMNLPQDLAPASSRSS